MARLASAPEAAPALHLRCVLLPGEDERELWVRDGCITFDRVPGAETLVRSGWAVPGLVDAHCHVGLGPHGGLEDRAEIEAQAVADRDAGALLVRDCGVPVDVRWVQARPDLPRIVRAGRHLARTRRYLPNVGLEMEPDALPDAAAVQARAGDGWVKIVGDWIDRVTGDLSPCWPAETLAAAVRRAHEAGARVTVHVFGEAALPDLLDAGVDCVEHGTGLDEDLIERMAASGTALVPTLVNIANFPDIAERAARFPVYAAHMRSLHATSRLRVRAAHEAGVPVYAGSDAGGGVAHGRAHEEIRELHLAGLPAEVALAAGSWGARSWLGLPGIVEGAPADLVIYERDPRLDLGVLAEPHLIVLGGRVVVEA